MKAFEVKVKWQGLEEIEDSWEPVKVLSEDVLQLMNNYANDKNDERLQRAVLDHKLQHAAVAALASATAGATSLSLDCHGLAGESNEE
ncbi:hypothetical protein PInf_008536 [Phytophthora infestans]|nr:hypothetical protein PInf_008536 [Phytophthora infestans]